MPPRPHRHHPHVRSDVRPVALLHQHLWRCVPKRFVKTLLEEPSFTEERRYGVRDEFGALHFAGSAEVAGQLGEDGEEMVGAEFEITAARLADVTQPTTRALLRVKLEDVIRPRISGKAYAVPQRIARRLYQQRFERFLAPSVHDPEGKRQGWLNLILAPAQLIRFAIREIRTIEFTPSRE
jgi:hypothetical protein